MKTQLFLLGLACLASVTTARAQSTAFTYQGRLTDNGAPASGRYDIRGRLFDAPSGGVPLGTTNVLPAVAVSNGLLTVQFDFGDAAFVGGSVRWLELAVRTNGVPEDFASLEPRQPLTPAPMALWAGLAGSAYGVQPGRVGTPALQDGAITAKKISSAGATPGQALFMDGTNVVWRSVAQQIRTITDLRSLPAGVALGVTLLGYHAAGDGGGGEFLWDAASTFDDDGGSVIRPASNAAAGRWLRRLGGPISIQWFGAVPNDASKAEWNVSAITNAIALAGKVSSGFNGGRVLFPPGKWHIDRPIEMRLVDSIILQSAGAAGYVDEFGHRATEIVWSGTAGGPLLSMVSCNRSGVRGLSFNGAGIATGGIHFDAVPGANGYPSKQCLFEDFEVKAVAGWGLSFGNSGNPDMVNNTFRNFVISDCAHGVRQEGNQSVQNIFEKGVVASYDGYGFRFDGGDITLSSMLFSSKINSIADVFVGGGAQYARFENNYHETFGGTAYLFEPFVAGQTVNRPHFTLLQGVRVLNFATNAPSGTPPGTPPRILDFQQTGYLTLQGCEFDGYNGKPCEIYLRAPGGANPGYVQESGCVYLNGARTHYVPTLGGFATHFSYNGLDPSKPPLPPSSVFTTPNAFTAFVDARLNLHNSVLTLADTYSIASNLFAWNLRSRSGELIIDTPQPRASGPLFSLQTNGTAVFSVNADGSARFTRGAVQPNTLNAAGAASGQGLVFDGTNVSWRPVVVPLPSLAALRALEAGALSNATILGYYSPGDGGAGEFVWNASSTAPDDGGSVIIPNSSPPAGRWKRGHDGTLSVKWFGAKGDGAVNDGPAIQRTINALPEGGVISLPAGIFRIEQPLSNTNIDGLRVIGAGPRATTIWNVQTNGGPAFRFTAPKPDVQPPGYYLDQLEIAHLRILGTNGGGAAAHLGFPAASLINDVRIDHPGGHGLEVEGAITTEFRRVVVTGVPEGRNSFHFRGGATTLWLTDCYSSNIGATSAGVRFEPLGGGGVYGSVTIRGGAFESAGYGLWLNSVYGAVINGAYFERNAEADICLGALTDNTPLAGSDSRGVVIESAFANGATGTNGQSAFLDIRYGRNVVVMGCFTTNHERAFKFRPSNSHGEDVLLLANEVREENETPPRGYDASAQVLTRLPGSLKGVTGIAAGGLSNPKNLRGSVAIQGTNTTGAVNFVRPEDDAAYFVSLAVSDTTGAPASGATRAHLSGKTAAGFTVNLETAPGGANTVTVDWILVR
jgi:hypothetical protein